KEIAKRRELFSFSLVLYAVLSKQKAFGMKKYNDFIYEMVCNKFKPYIFYPKYREPFEKEYPDNPTLVATLCKMLDHESSKRLTLDQIDEEFNNLKTP